jgi:hypothetical protein
MTAPAARRVAEVLAQRLGLEVGEVESTIAADPFTAAFALSLMGQSAPEERGGAAATVRFVASLVGACPICLGEDDECPECGGRGKPGCRQPDGEALMVWIARPLRRLGLCVGSLRQGAATNLHEGGIR